MNWSQKQFKKSYTKGNTSQWRAAATALKKEEIDDDLVILGLNEKPSDLRTLQKARNTQMLKNHPDLGGTNEKAILIQNAYERIKNLIVAGEK